MRCRTKHCETILYSWNKRREASPRNTRHLTNAGSQLVQRRFRRASVKTSICPISPSSQYTLLMCARHVRLIDGAHNTTKLHIIILQKRSGNSKKSSPNVGLMLAHRLRRCPSINPTPDQHLMFAGHIVLLG